MPREPRDNRSCQAPYPLPHSLGSLQHLHAKMSPISFSSILAAAALAGTVLGTAIPSGAKIGTVVNDGKHTFKQVPNPGYKFNGALSVYKTYLKFGAPIPDYLHEAVAKARLGKRATGSASATPIDTFDDAYVTPVSIGTPAQVLNLDFDTGSSDLWVFSNELPPAEINGQHVYKPGSSSTAVKVSGSTWSISYGDGSSSSGDVYKDKVTIGGLTVAQQVVEAAQQVSESFSEDPSIDGLVGLGFDSLNSVSPTPAKTWFTNVKSQLTLPVFAADLKHNAAGTYDFGFIDSAKYTGSITYTPVNTSPGYWKFTSSGYRVGSGTFTSTSITGIADTGTTLLYLPTTIVNAYYKQVSKATNSNTYGGYVFPCSSALPTFTFGVGTARITIPSTFMNYGPVADGSTTCFGGLQSSSGIGINIFGDVALKAAYVVFDGSSSPRLGWAAKNL
ncbi:aspartic-type endopeptidase-like protein [Apodospora peruviana]|uniref:Aspartic-type endopeptidase-like protein n=1 Tax=Apodospora peruviana TaxID=516989 RepID=A0AAE0I770_9PEZI|nr:aspartic-type endopeptidase-like protein [Apodospora peruviana]